MEIFAAFPGAHFLIAGLVGLIVGSFLNVVAYRVPIMLGRAGANSAPSFRLKIFRNRSTRLGSLSI